MKRLIFVAVAFLVGCNGMGSGANRFLPASPSGSDGIAAQSETPAMPGVRRGEKTRVLLTMTIPRRHRHGRAEVHPSTISPQTQSVSVTVNGGSASVFNATPTSAACHAGPTGTVCTFVVNAPVGSDTFVIATYSSVGGGGTKLDQGSAVFNIVRGKNNAPSVRLGPVVTNTSDSGVGSLRYAIGSASPGDTIMVLLPSTSTITVMSPITISNRVSIAGPGVSASARHHGREPHATYTGVKISGGGTQQIFAIQAGATVTISGLILTAGNAGTTAGGAINNLGTLTLVADVFTDNKTTVTGPLAIRAPRPHDVRKHAGRAHAPAPHPGGSVRHPHCTTVYQVGGAIYNNGTLTVSGSTFDGNVESSDFASCVYGGGGAIFNDTAGILASSGNVYTNNAAYEGGAVFNYSEYGQASFSGDTFSANEGCTATSGCPTSGCATTCTSYAQGEGAAIYDDYGPGVSIANCAFTANVTGGMTAGSYGEGGALYLDEGQVTITNSSFTNNLAGGGTTNESTGYGGAIYWDGNSTGMLLTGDTFTGNRAAGDEAAEGGAIIAYEPINGSNDKFISNVAAGTGSVQYTNGYAEGGAIYESDGVTFTATMFSSNSATAAATADGGAIYISDNAVLQGNTFTSNTAIATASTSTTGSAYGGALYVDSGLSAKNNTFTSNRATFSGTLPGYAYGGAAYNDSSMTTFNDTFTSNSATSPTAAAGVTYGGAIYNNSTLVMSGDSITSSSATSAYEAYGGALYSGDSNTTISNTTFASSTATASHEALGGAIYDEMGLTLSGSTISGSKASNGGGGIYAANTETIAGSTIKGNTVVSAGDYGGGGGIYIDSAMTISNSTISGNTVTVAGTYAGGGGIYNDSGLTIAGSTVSGNTVSGSGAGSGGGGVFSYDTMAMINTTIVANHSGIDGGGYMTYGNYTNALSNVTLFQNSATGSGGNIANPWAMILTNTIVAGGTAGTGADIDNPGTITSGDYNIVQTAVVGNALTGTTTHNVTANPLLLASTNNGGPTFTNADQSASPGRADIPFSGGMCNGVAGTNVDQRGFTRGAGGRCDVGAYEFAGVASAIRPHLTPVRGNHHQRAHVHAHRNPAQPISATR